MPLCWWILFSKNGPWLWPPIAMYSNNNQQEKKLGFALKGSAMSSNMLCCGGNKETGRDMKSAQNTPSRQPMNLPYQGGTAGVGGVNPGGSKGLSPPPLTQAARLQQQMNSGHINNFDLRNDFKKVRCKADFMIWLDDISYSVFCGILFFRGHVQQTSYIFKYFILTKNNL